MFTWIAAKKPTNPLKERKIFLSSFRYFLFCFRSIVKLAAALTYTVFVPNIRATLDSLGASMEVAKYTERLVPSSRIVSVDGVAPALPGANNFIAPSASVIGNVTIGEHSR
jgi:hypothetical protein